MAEVHRRGVGFIADCSGSGVRGLDALVGAEGIEGGNEGRERRSDSRPARARQEGRPVNLAEAQAAAWSSPPPSRTTVAERARGILARLGLVVLVSGCATVKPPLRAADEALKAACEGLAQAIAERSGADAQRIVAASCLVEGFTRT